MSSSVLKEKKPKFLLDENVKVELLRYLEQQGFDVVLKSRGTVNGKLGEFSKKEKRVLITNDRHFSDASLFPKEKIFSVIWLRNIPQNEPMLLISAFSKLLENPPDFDSNLIRLYPDKFDIKPILSKST